MAWHSGKPADSDFLSVSVQHIRENFAELEPLQPHVDALVNTAALAPHIAELLSSRIVDHNLDVSSPPNGWYVRWENGLQICFGGQKVAEVGLVHTSAFIWTYPAVFVDSPTAVGTRSSDGTTKDRRLTGPSIRDISGTTATYFIHDPDAGFLDEEIWYVYPIAVGRWK